MRITNHLAVLLGACLVSAALAPSAVAQPARNDPPPDKSGGEPAGKPGVTGAGGDSAGESTDVDALRKEYLRLRDLLFRSRARAAAVASALFSSKIRLHLNYTTGRFYTIRRATIRVDNANVFDDSDGAVAKNKAPRFDGYVAPGKHKITYRIEAIGKDDNRFVSTVENSVTVFAPAGSDLVITAKAKDGGDIPYKWKQKKRGSYKLHLDIDVKAVPREKGKKK